MWPVDSDAGQADPYITLGRNDEPRNRNKRDGASALWPLARRWGENCRVASLYLADGFGGISFDGTYLELYNAERKSVVFFI